MTHMSQYEHYYRTHNANALASDIRSGRIAYIHNGRVLGDGYFPAMMEFIGASSSYYDSSENWDFSSGVSMVVQIRMDPFLDATYPNKYCARTTGTANHIKFALLVESSDTPNAEERNKAAFLVQSTTGANICFAFTDADVCDGAVHTLLFSYNQSTGVAHVYVDGVESLNESSTSYALTTGTVATGSGPTQIGGLTGVGRWIDGGAIGYLGGCNTYIDFSIAANRDKFLDSNGLFIRPDEAAWSQWGGVQPAFWNEHGEGSNNKGSGNNLPLIGTVNVMDAL